MTGLSAAFRLIRPINGLVAALSTIPAASIACGKFTFLWREAAVIYLLVSFGYSVNDIFDVDADRINRPDRSIPSGRVSQKTAITIAALTGVTGAVGAAIVSNEFFIYYSAVALLLFFYALKISAILLLGNLLVALLCASVFVPAVMKCRPDDYTGQIIVTAALLTFLYHLGREIVKDIEDMVGDRAIHRSTIPLKYGSDRARNIAAGLFALLIALSYGAYSHLNLSSLFLAAITIGVNLPVVLIFIKFYRSEPEKGAKFASIALKGVMLPALLSLYFANVK